MFTQCWNMEKFYDFVTLCYTNSILGDTSNPGPEVRPDGRAPRVKSNLEALRNNQGRKVVGNPVRDTTESVFNLIPTGRPFVSTPAVPPLAPAPTVEPTREEDHQFSNFPFRQDLDLLM